MININDVFKSFSKQESREFIMFLKRHYKPSWRKDIALYKLLRKNEALSTKQIILKLYGDRKQQEAYYQLKRRLKTQLETYILTIGDRTDIKTDILKNLTIAEYYFKKNMNQFGWHYLIYAEKEASSAQLYSLLNFVYRLQIEYIDKDFAPKLNTVIRKIKQNTSLADLAIKINIAGKLISEKISKSRIESKKINIDYLLSNALKRSGINPKLIADKHTRLYYNMILVISEAMFYKNELITLEPYLIEQYNKLKTNGFFNSHSYQEQTDFLYKICLTNLKNKHFDSLETFLEEYFNLLVKEKKINGPLFQGYAILKMGHYMFTNQNKQAILLINDLLSNIKIKLNKAQKILINLNLSIAYFQTEDFEEALNIYLKIQLPEKKFIERMGIKGEFNKRLYECLIHFELKNVELVNSLIKSIERKFKTNLQANVFIREASFLKFFKEINNNINILSDEVFQKRIIDFTQNKTINIGNEEIINFDAWLLAKIKKKEYAIVLSELVKTA